MEITTRRKMKKTTIRLPETLKIELEKLAEKKFLSLNSLVRAACLEYLARNTKS